MQMYRTYFVYFSSVLDQIFDNRGKLKWRLIGHSENVIRAPVNTIHARNVCKTRVKEFTVLSSLDDMDKENNTSHIITIDINKTDYNHQNFDIQITISYFHLILIFSVYM